MITQGIRYAGSKNKLLSVILNTISIYKPKIVIDAFGGSTRVSQALKSNGYTVIGNDIALWSKTFNTTFLLNNKSITYYLPLIEHLNTLTPIDGWFSDKYGGCVVDGLSVGKDGNKKPWQLKNTRKLDAIRLEIDRIAVDDLDKQLLLTALILGLDKVDNTLGHHVSYVNKWSSRSYNDLILEIPKYNPDNLLHRVYQSDATNVLQSEEYDLAYLDPPYGSNNDQTPTTRVRYKSYYHLWETIILNDQPETFGAANRRVDSLDKLNYNPYEDYKKQDGVFLASIALSKLIDSTTSDITLVSYSNNGRVSVKEFIEIISDRLVDTIVIPHNSHNMTHMSSSGVYRNADRLTNEELIFVIKKGNNSR